VSISRDLKSEIVRSGFGREQIERHTRLLREPDVLLLDEPTHHLDIAAITWLENCALIFITHDRILVKHLATGMVERGRGRFSFFPGDFEVIYTKKKNCSNSRRVGLSNSIRSSPRKRRGSAKASKPGEYVRAVQAMRRVRSVLRSTPAFCPCLTRGLAQKRPLAESGMSSNVAEAQFLLT
jgi:ATPase subunit of ABC transporter with duplicated ATPase domains